jgi:hypothetical protein
MVEKKYVFIRNKKKNTIRMILELLKDPQFKCYNRYH